MADSACTLKQKSKRALHGLKPIQAFFRNPTYGTVLQARHCFRPETTKADQAQTRLQLRLIIKVVLQMVSQVVFNGSMTPISPGRLMHCEIKSTLNTRTVLPWQHQGFASTFFKRRLARSSEGSIQTLRITAKDRSLYRKLPLSQRGWGPRENSLYTLSTASLIAARRSNMAPLLIRFN